MNYFLSGILHRGISCDTKNSIINLNSLCIIMNKLCKISALFSVLVLVSACKTGSAIDKQNVSSVDKTVTNNITRNVENVTSSAAATSNATTKSY